MRSEYGVDLEFMECPDCGSKPGSPDLCKPCLHNRWVITRLQHENEKRFKVPERLIWLMCYIPLVNRWKGCEAYSYGF